MTGTLLLVAFLFSGPVPMAVWAVPVLGAVLGAGALLGHRFNLWGLLFRHGLVPILRLGPPLNLKPAAPARFAMILGTLFLAVATVLLLVSTGTGILHWVGWALALMVAALALLAAITELCVGCEIYNLVLRLRTRRIPGD